MSVGLFSFPPKKFGGRTKFFCRKWKKSKLFKIAWNGEKISRKRVLDFLGPPPQKKLGGGKKFFFWKKKIFPPPKFFFFLGGGGWKVQKPFTTNFLAISGNFEPLWFFHFWKQNFVRPPNFLGGGGSKVQKSFSTNFLAISEKFEQLWFFSFLTKNYIGSLFF